MGVANTILMRKLILIFFIAFSGFPFDGESQQYIPELEQVQAVGASEFLNSIGVCSSITGRGETLQGTIDALEYTGIRFIRCGLEDGISTADMIKLHNKTGAKIVYGLLSGGTNIERLIQESRVLAEAGALLAIEGNNEPNNWGVTYEGEKGGENHSWLPVANLQRDLYQAVKSDPVLKNIPVWNISESGAQTDNVGLQFLKIPDGAETLMPAGTQYADFANCHNYITHTSWPGLHDNQTWESADPGPDCPVDGLHGNYGKTWLNSFDGYSEKELQDLPRVTTETGIAAKGEITEEIQARLFLNLYLSQFKRGWSHTSVYLLRTRSNEPAHESYAFYKMDYSPKQAAHYLHNFTTILEDKGTISNPDKLSYFVQNRPETVHDLLLQKSNGKFFLVLWGERFTGGTDKITVQLDRIFPSVKIYDPTHGTNPVMRLNEAREINLVLDNHPLIIELQ
jgi:hypothetical protein